MKKTLFALTIAFSTALSTLAMAEQKETTYYTGNGNKVYGSDISYDRLGNATFGMNCYYYDYDGNNVNAYNCYVYDEFGNAVIRPSNCCNRR